jgi:phosphoenolpyruvate-protein kinase (PTS system EI component)
MSVARKHIEQRLKVAIDALPSKKLEQLTDYAEYLKSYEEWEATLELLNDPGMKKDVDNGLAQATHNEGYKWREVVNAIR